MPYNCHVHFDNLKHHNGWQMRHVPSLEKSFTACSSDFFGAGFATAGKGGGDKNVMRLQAKYDQAVTLVTGAAGPDSCLCAANERLNLDYCKKFTGALSHLIGAIGAHK